MSLTSKVEIDSRLSDLFQSRKREAQEGTNVNVEEECKGSLDQQGLSWLSNFKTVIPGDMKEHESSSARLDVISTYRVPRGEVRPFWASDDKKSMVESWKKSRIVLARDCHKQRKAAVRKTIRR